MQDALDWLTDHWQTIVQVGGALYVLISVVVAATPSKEDDAWWARVAQRLSFLKPTNVPGTLSLPGHRHSAEDVALPVIEGTADPGHFDRDTPAETPTARGLRSPPPPPLPPREDDTQP